MRRWNASKRTPHVSQTKKTKEITTNAPFCCADPDFITAGQARFKFRRRKAAMVRRAQKERFLRPRSLRRPPARHATLADPDNTLRVRRRRDGRRANVRRGDAERCRAPSPPRLPSLREKPGRPCTHLSPRRVPSQLTQPSRGDVYYEHRTGKSPRWIPDIEIAFFFWGVISSPLEKIGRPPFCWCLRTGSPLSLNMSTSSGFWLS